MPDYDHLAQVVGLETATDSSRRPTILVVGDSQVQDPNVQAIFQECAPGAQIIDTAKRGYGSLEMDTYLEHNLETLKRAGTELDMCIITCSNDSALSTADQAYPVSHARTVEESLTNIASMVRKVHEYSLGQGASTQVVLYTSTPMDPERMVYGVQKVASNANTIAYAYGMQELGKALATEFGSEAEESGVTSVSCVNVWDPLVHDMRGQDGRGEDDDDEGPLFLDGIHPTKRGRGTFRTATLDSEVFDTLSDSRDTADPDTDASPPVCRLSALMPSSARLAPYLKPGQERIHGLHNLYGEQPSSFDLAAAGDFRSTKFGTLLNQGRFLLDQFSSDKADPMPFNWDQPLTFAEWEMDDPAMAQSVKEAVEGVVADMWSEGLGSDEDYDDGADAGTTSDVERKGKASSLATVASDFLQRKDSPAELLHDLRDRYERFGSEHPHAQSAVSYGLKALGHLTRYAADKVGEYNANHPPPHGSLVPPRLS